MEAQIGNSVIYLLDIDLTEMKVEAIVNPANTALQLGGGVAGAIRHNGGPDIQKACDVIGGTPVGTAVITTGGNLKAKYVIHAVGPMMGEGDEDQKLGNATLNALKIAEKNNIKTIAFPAISTGIFGFPIQRCAEIMLHTTIDYLQGETVIQQISFCLFGPKVYDIFESKLNDIVQP